MVLGKRHRPVGKISRGIRVAVLFSLVVILSPYFLPLVHFYQPAITPTTVQARLQGVTLPNINNYEVSSQPYHDPYTCPVCEYSPELQVFLISTLAIGSTCSVFVQPFSFDGSRLKIAGPNHLVSEPRAPPIAL
jgi:hypothetical protein